MYLLFTSSEKYFLKNCYCNVKHALCQTRNYRFFGSIRRAKLGLLISYEYISLVKMV